MYLLTESVPTLGANAFLSTSSYAIVVKSSLYSDFCSALRWSTIKSSIFSYIEDAQPQPNCTNVKTFYGDIVSITQDTMASDTIKRSWLTTLGTGLVSSYVTEISFDDPTITKLSTSACYNFKNLKALSNCENITSIGSRAFYGCYNLIQVSFP